MVFVQKVHVLNVFPSELIDCPQEKSAYWLFDYPSYCVPPPTDHSAFLSVKGSAAPAFCLFLNGIVPSTVYKKDLGSCSYL
jgi:hypothetical protein